MEWEWKAKWKWKWGCHWDTGRRTMILLPKRSDKLIYGPGIETDQKQIKANQGVYTGLYGLVILYACAKHRSSITERVTTPGYFQSINNLACFIFCYLRIVTIPSVSLPPHWFRPKQSLFTKSRRKKPALHTSCLWLRKLVSGDARMKA